MVDSVSSSKSRVQTAASTSALSNIPAAGTEKTSTLLSSDLLVSEPLLSAGRALGGDTLTLTTLPKSASTAATPAQSLLSGEAASAKPVSASSAKVGTQALTTPTPNLPQSLIPESLISAEASTATPPAKPVSASSAKVGTQALTTPTPKLPQSIIPESLISAETFTAKPPAKPVSASSAKVGTQALTTPTPNLPPSLIPAQSLFSAEASTAKPPAKPADTPLTETGETGVTVAFSKGPSKSATLKVQKPTFPEGGFKVADIQETLNHLNGTNDSKGISLEALGQHPHHANLAKAFEAYAENTRFDAAKRADAAKFAQTENKRANELKFLASTAFIAQKDGNAKKLTLAEVKSLDLNKDGNITQDEVATIRARFPALKIPNIEKKKEAKPNLKRGEFDLKAVQGVLNQIDNKTRSGEVTQEMIQKAVTTSGKKLDILNEILKDPTLKRRFGGAHAVPEAIEREKGTVKNGTFLLKQFNQISPLDAANAGINDLLKKTTSISPEDLKRIAARQGSKAVISPQDFRNGPPMDSASLVRMLMLILTMLLQMPQQPLKK